MLKLIKILNSTILGYWYIPENKDPGLIEINKKTGEVIISIESNYDKELGYPYYANKARGEVKKMLDEGNLVVEKTINWI